MNKLYYLGLILFGLSTSITLSQEKTDLSKTIIKEGNWHGEFIYNSGLSFPISIEVEKSKKGKFSGTLYWYNYFNTKTKISGDLTKKQPEFHEYELEFGKAMNFGDYFIESVKNDTLIAYSTNDDTNQKDATFRLIHESKIDQEALTQIEKNIQVNVDKFGTQEFSFIKNEKLQQEVLDKTKAVALADTSYSKPFRVVGSVTQENQFSGELEGYFKLPNYTYLKFRIMGIEVMSGKNPMESWTYSSIENKLTVNATEKDTESEESSPIMKSNLHDLIEKGYKVRNFGEGKVNGEDCYRVVIEKGMDYRGFYFSKDNFFPLREEKESGINEYKLRMEDVTPIMEEIVQIGMKDKFIMTFDSVFRNQEVDTLLFYPTEAMLAVKVKQENSQVKGADYFNDKGIAFFKQGDYEKAKAEFDNAININRNNSTYFSNRGRTNLELSNFYEAISDFNQSNQLSEGPKEELHYYLGLAKFNLKDYNNAIVDFNRAVKEDTAHLNRKFYNYLALSYYNSNQKDSAMVYFEVCANQEDAIAMDYYNYGYLLRGSEEYEKSIPYFQKVTDLEPENDHYKNHFGISLYAAGRFDEARVQFKQAISLNPNVVDYYNNLGDVYYQLDSINNALVNYQKVENLIEKDNDNIFFKLGRTYHADGDYINAMKYYDKAIALNTTNAKYYDSRGYLKKIVNDKKGAIQDFTTSINIYNKDPEIYYQRGLIQKDLHNNQSACNDFHLAVEYGHKEAQKLIDEDCNFKEQ
ncbi:tetratricopeptide repeat protein [Flammeovirga pacifica]|uniref:Uncharacterized protein n=1 Tax=Flammeovirga pacifica TaxID=915059 RepID=A0A1S1YYB5_FLAPC|nr:tetratricopeptide repeat protein [Flammeovirga pacifica]OHX65980.1 hypothetical protein NH26_06255 [Flammeovirga pacifica]